MPDSNKCPTSGASISANFMLTPLYLPPALTFMLFAASVKLTVFSKLALLPVSALISELASSRLLSGALGAALAACEKA